MSWKELPLTRGTLIDRGLRVVGVWTPSQNLNIKIVYVRWQDDPEGHEKRLAEDLIFAPDIRHIGLGDVPKGCPWE